MFDDKDRKWVEKELSNNVDQKRDDDVEVSVSSFRSNRGFNNKFDSLKVKYKKDKKKYLVALSAAFAIMSMAMGSSYAYLTMTSKTNNSVVINAGTLALTFQNEANVITLENAVPMSDKAGLDSENEYSFDIKNNGDIPATYVVTLDNTCETGNGITACIPDEHIKVGLKVGTNDYKVLEKNGEDEYMIETGALEANGSNTYKMKIWLAQDTPNTYNAKGNKTIVYKGKLGLAYEQGSRVTLTLDADGGTIPTTTGWTISGDKATKQLAAGIKYGALPTPTKEGATFAGWKVKLDFPANKWEQGTITDADGSINTTTTTKRLRLKDFQEVIPSSTYTLKITGDTNTSPIHYRHVWYYDKDYNFISAYSILGSERTITIPSTCKYIKTVIQHREDNTDISLEQIGNVGIYFIDKTQTVSSESRLGNDSNQSLIATWNSN